MKTFDIRCSWADSCASMDDIIEVGSYNELFEKMEEFFSDACGITAVESFAIALPYVEGSVIDTGSDLYWWDNKNLKRSKDLSDVWNKVKKEIKEEFGEEYFNEDTK